MTDPTQKLIQSRDEIRRRVIHEDNKRRLSMLLLAHRIEMYKEFDRRK